MPSRADVKIEISVAEPADADLLARLGRETFLSAFQGLIKDANLLPYADERFGPRQQAAELAEPGNRFFIAWRDSHAAGYAKLCASVPPPCIDLTRTVELERLYLHAEWHGLGVADALMNVCLAEARRKTCESMWLDVWDANVRAQAFYRKFRFELVGERPYIVGAQEQRHLLMYRELS